MAIPKELIYRGDYTIRTYEIDANKKITITSFVNLLQDAAMRNVMLLNVSVWDLAAQNISWILLRKKLVIHRLPELGEKITIETHPAGFDKLFTYRDYKVYDAEGILIAQSSSTWLLLNMLDRTAAKIPQSILDRGELDNSDCLPKPKSKLKKITAVQNQKTFEVHWHDLDFNHHLSNIRYLQWMFEPLDFYTQQKGSLKELNIVYRTEGNLGDIITAETQQIAPNTYLHQLIRVNDKELLATAQTEWIIRED